MAVTGPDSTAGTCQRNRITTKTSQSPTFCSRADDHLKILVVVKHQDDPFRSAKDDGRRDSEASRSAEIPLSRLGEHLLIEFS
jgi:hypothetical protein